MQNPSILKLTGITKSFGATRVLNGIDLDVGAGEFVTILGSSGCGKTTLLRIIAGLEEADGGTVFLSGRDVTSAEPNTRNVNTVFQNYALFPHMTVGENVGYALKIKKVPKAARAGKVKDALRLVQLEGYEHRFPDALSGGQKQRVAIARAIVAEPAVLLLDEPLGALDLNLRRQMQIELKNLQKQLGITFIYITHDQEEALTMSDRVAVMKDGQFLQVGTPSEIYDSPVNGYIARFVGESNVLPCTLRDLRPDGAVVDCLGGSVEVRRGTELPSVDGVPHTLRPGDRAAISIRGETIRLSGEGDGISCTVLSKNFTGGLMKLTLVSEVGGVVFTASRYGITADINEGDRIKAHFPPLSGVLLSGEQCGDEVDGQ